MVYRLKVAEPKVAEPKVAEPEALATFSLLATFVFLLRQPLGGLP